MAASTWASGLGRARRSLSQQCSTSSCIAGTAALRMAPALLRQRPDSHLCPAPASRGAHARHTKHTRKHHTKLQAHGESPWLRSMPEDSFVFVEREYERVVLVQHDPYGPMKLLPPNDRAGVTQYASYCGVIVFQRAHDQEPWSPDTRIMEVFVAGDSAQNIYTALAGQSSSRPMAHDLLNQTLDRLSDYSRGQCKLLRVAIVGLENDVFIGRLFFGDPATGVVTWDCDCRPSDGVYLSLKTGCNFYVARNVWESAAVPIRLSKVHELAVQEAASQALVQQEQPQQQAGAAAGSGAAQAQPDLLQGTEPERLQLPASAYSDTLDYTALRPDDPPPVKRLKLELAVAVRDEDYAAAIRIRDHPYMALYRRAQAAQEQGRRDEADGLVSELHTLIRQYSQ